MIKETVFNFSNDHVKAKIAYDLQLFKRIGKSFDYTHKKLVSLGHHVEGDKPQLSKGICIEGKNYNWVAVTSGNVKILIRTYDNHFTVYTCLEETHEYKNTKTGKMCTYTDKEYGAFTYHTDTTKITIDDEIEGIPKPKNKDEDYIEDYYMDCFYNNPFTMFNTQLKGLIDVIGKHEVHTLWNDYSFARPKFVSIKIAYNGESVSSFDKLFFCAEELSCKHMELFAENEMLEGIKKFKVGDEFKGKFNKGIITEVRTEVEDGYYHGVGLTIGEEWCDVYSLTHWDLDGVFPDEKSEGKA